MKRILCSTFFAAFMIIISINAQNTIATTSTEVIVDTIIKTTRAEVPIEPIGKKVITETVQVSNTYKPQNPSNKPALYILPIEGDMNQVPPEIISKIETTTQATLQNTGRWWVHELGADSVLANYTFKFRIDECKLLPRSLSTSIGVFNYFVVHIVGELILKDVEETEIYPIQKIKIREGEKVGNAVIADLAIAATLKLLPPSKTSEEAAIMALEGLYSSNAKTPEHAANLAMRVLSKNIEQYIANYYPLVIENTAYLSESNMIWLPVGSNTNIVEGQEFKVYSLTIMPGTTIKRRTELGKIKVRKNGILGTNQSEAIIIEGDSKIKQAFADKATIIVSTIVKQKK